MATQAVRGLSYLNVWWMWLGIRHQRSRPGCPQDNRAHGLEETDDGLWTIYFHTLLLATFDERDYIIRAEPHV